MIRNKEIPLFYWIREKGSINNLSHKDILGYKPIGWHIALEVLNRYYKLYKIKPNKMSRYDKIVTTLAYRFGSKPQFVLDNFDRIFYGTI